MPISDFIFCILASKVVIYLLLPIKLTIVLIACFPPRSALIVPVNNYILVHVSVKQLQESIHNVSSWMSSNGVACNY